MPLVLRGRLAWAHDWIGANWTAIAKFDGEFGAGAQTYGGTGTLKYSW